MKSLDIIGMNKGTDKSSKGHNYLCYYEMFFDAVRYKPVTLLEIGVDKGDSLLTWHEYFPHSEIHGIDIRDGYEYLHELGIKTHVVDQSSKVDLVLFGEQYNDYFTIIICDGSHMAEDDILTFETLFPYLKSGGFYVIEDTLCSHDKTRWGKNANVYDRIRQMVGEVSMNGKMSNSNICANKKVEAKKYELDYFEANIEWVFCSAGTTIIKKI